MLMARRAIKVTFEMTWSQLLEVPTVNARKRRACRGNPSIPSKTPDMNRRNNRGKSFWERRPKRRNMLQ